MSKSKLNGVDPQCYLTDVLTKLVNNWPNRRLDELMPWYAAAVASWQRDRRVHLRRTR